MALLACSIAHGEDEKPTSPKLATNITHHSLETLSGNISYRAETGMLGLKNISGLPDASFFYIYYSCSDNASTPASSISGNGGSRPIIFSFNGGPGSSSVWMHLGFLGPQRVVIGDSGLALPPPASLEPNPHSALAQADLVFIDPITTGFSRADEAKKAGDFHDFNADIKSVSEFIRLFLTKKQKWACPKLIIGESYGTIRAVGVANYLLKEHGIGLNGIILVSSVLNFQALHTAPGSDLYYLMFLPSLSATAWYHQALAPEPQKLELSDLLKQAEQFCATEYVQKLFAGSALEKTEKDALNHKLSTLTGLSPEVVATCEQRIPMSLFSKRLLEKKGLMLGRMDSRVLGYTLDPLSPSMDYDPCLSSLLTVFSGAMNLYLQKDLATFSDEPYEILTGKVHPWRWGVENQYLNVCDRLSSTMVQNPSMKVFVVSGIYDLATPYFATEYNLRHLELPHALRKNILSKNYLAGHMPFLDKTVLVNLSADLKNFILQSCRTE